MLLQLQWKDKSHADIRHINSTITRIHTRCTCIPQHIRTETSLYSNSWEVLFGQMMGAVTWSWSMGVMSMPLPLSTYVVAYANTYFAVGSFHLMNQWTLCWKYARTKLWWEKLIFLSIFFLLGLPFTLSAYQCSKTARHHYIICS